MAASRPEILTSFLEALEARIAPAVVINVGAPEVADGSTPIDPQSFNYNYAPAGENNPFVSVAPNVYRLELSAAQGASFIKQINLYNPGTAFQPWINLGGGGATLFFTDRAGEPPVPGQDPLPPDGIVQANELTGISFGNRLNLTVEGSVFGDIVATGGGQGTSLVTPAGPSISFLKIAGSVDGSIVAAGAISNVEIAGSVDRISTASGGEIAFNLGLGERTLNAFNSAAGIAGGSLKNLKIGQADLIQAGDGGSGAAGGSIRAVTIVDDPNGIGIFAGDGGGGARGGAGGSIDRVLVFGAGESANPEAIVIRAGDGGDASGAGGRGGAVTNVNVGYGSLAASAIPSPEPSANPVLVAAGDGGSGSQGGVGGQVKTVNILVKTPDRPDLDEISVLGGNGGAGTVRDGAGGNVNGIVAKNVYFNLAMPSSDLDSILVRGGDAGTGGGEGARGGNVSAIDVLADRIEVRGGAGADGIAAGGAGGSLSRVELLFTESELVRSLYLQGGDGGAAASTGQGGAGGFVKDVKALSAGFQNNDDAFKNLPSLIAAGSGGGGGIGGAGGALSNVELFKSGAGGGGASADEAKLEFRAGDGGDGLRLGGKGGGATTLTFFGLATSPSVFAGAGGDASAGKGGGGGSLSRIAFKSADTLGPIIANAGDGGNGSGGTGRGGAGGGASQINVQVTSDVQIRSGAGGSGVAAVGAGGSLRNAVGLTATGSASVEAGEAGLATGSAARGASGGSIGSVLAVGSADITIRAGNGSAGGAGGSITSAAWYAGVFDDRALVGVGAPNGSVTVQAGHGSALGNAAGAGGSVKGAAGFSSGLPTGSLLVAAGDGNGLGGPSGARGAAGGAVTDVSLFGGAAAGVIRAGDGGDAPGQGGKGGAVTKVAAAEGVNLHAISAGNGGSGSTRGGLGGSVTQISVFGDIGVRSGKAFGFDADGAGGIFAGGGGNGPTAGKAGSVTDVTAAAIASIVAGRPTTADPANLQLATLVDRVNLRGLAAPTVVFQPGDPLFGAFDKETRPAELPSPGFPFGKPATVAFDEANFVGSVGGEPGVRDANVYRTLAGPVSSLQTAWVLGSTAPLDGLVAAITLGQDRNFRPEALLTVTDPRAPTNFVLLDYRNNYTINS